LIEKPTVLVGPPVLVLRNDKLVMEKLNNYVVGLNTVVLTNTYNNGITAERYRSAGYQCRDTGNVHRKLAKFSKSPLPI